MFVHRYALYQNYEERGENFISRCSQLFATGILHKTTCDWSKGVNRESGDDLRWVKAVVFFFAPTLVGISV